MLNDKEVKSLIKAGNIGKFAIGHGLYLRISSEKTPFWIVRYSINGKRREISIGRYGIRANETTLKNALNRTFEIKSQLADGIDPLAEKKRNTGTLLATVNDLAEDWLTKDIEPRLKHPKIPRRIYVKEIKPTIGEMSIERVTPIDIRQILHTINLSGRPSISNDTLMYCKQLFNHGISLNLIQMNPAASLTIRHAGGIERSRERVLSEDEIKCLLPTLKNNNHQFTRENYIAVLLLLMIGVRKNELLTAKWADFNFESNIWSLARERNNKGASIDIPLPHQALTLLNELKIRACGSDYLFPNRRKSKRADHVSADTLNHALSKMFGKQTHTSETNNILGKLGIEYFTVHDLRRTCRTLLAKIGVEGHIAERCLNHKIRGIEAIYNQHDYLDERKVALQKLADYLEELVILV